MIWKVLPDKCFKSRYAPHFGGFQFSNLNWHFRGVQNVYGIGSSSVFPQNDDWFEIVWCRFSSQQFPSVCFVSYTVILFLSCDSVNLFRDRRQMVIMWKWHDVTGSCAIMVDNWMTQACKHMVWSEVPAGNSIVHSMFHFLWSGGDLRKLMVISLGTGTLWKKREVHFAPLCCYSWKIAPLKISPWSVHSCYSYMDIHESLMAKEIFALLCMLYSHS